MRKMLLAITILFLFASSAYTENIESFVDNYNLQAKSITGADCLENEYLIVTDRNGKKHYRFELGEMLVFIREDFHSVNCQAKEKDSAAFIRCAGALALAMAGEGISFLDLCGNLLSQFYFAGTENKDLFSFPAVLGNYILMISRENDVYSFTMVISDSTNPI